MNKFIEYQHKRLSQEAVLVRSREIFEEMAGRRSVRNFSRDPISREVIENLIRTASTAPSGAHKQPWTFCAVSDPLLKEKIRKAAEEEEYKNYHGRMSEEWLKDLEPFDTDWNKPFLTDAPWLIVVFKQIFEKMENGKKNNYYVSESVGIATGFLLTAIHQAGLCALTHTPSPMNFLEKLLERPGNERAYMLIPVGYPAEGTKVPDLKRKSLVEISEWYAEG